MAELEIAPMVQRLEDDMIARLHGILREQGVSRLPKEAGAATTLANRIDEDVLREFLDLLEVHDAACDIYLPVDLSSPVRLGSLRVGTTQLLLDALEELREDLEILDEDDDEEDDEEMEARLRDLWRLFQEGAEAAQLRRLPLHVHA